MPEMQEMREMREMREMLVTNEERARIEKYRATHALRARNWLDGKAIDLSDAVEELEQTGGIALLSGMFEDYAVAVGKQSDHLHTRFNRLAALIEIELADVVAGKVDWNDAGATCQFVFGVREGVPR
jgi:hypothetical protein